MSAAYDRYIASIADDNDDDLDALREAARDEMPPAVVDADGTYRRMMAAREGLTLSYLEMLIANGRGFEDWPMRAPVACPWPDCDWVGTLDDCAVLGAEENFVFCAGCWMEFAPEMPEPLADPEPARKAGRKTKPSRGPMLWEDRP